MIDRTIASLASRSAFNRAVFSRVARASDSYSIIAFRPSCVRSSFLKCLFALSRTLSEFVKIFSCAAALPPKQSCYLVRRAVHGRLTCQPLEGRRPRLAHQFARIKRLSACRDVGQQNIHKRVLAIERRAALIFRCGNSLDRCEVALAECVVLLAIKAAPPSVGLSGIDPVVHDAPADERRYLAIAVPAVEQQSIAVMRAIVDGKFVEFHGRSYLAVRLYEIGRQLSPPFTLYV